MNWTDAPTGKCYDTDVSALKTCKWLGPITPPQPPEDSR